MAEQREAQKSAARVPKGGVRTRGHAITMRKVGGLQTAQGFRSVAFLSLTTIAAVLGHCRTCQGERGDTTRTVITDGNLAISRPAGVG
jgi:hypothetical protein